MEEQKPIKKDTVSSSPAVETFTDDMVKVIEDSQGGLIKKIIEEQEKHEVEKVNFSPESKRNRTFVFVSLILILISVSLLAFLFFRERGAVIPIQNTPVRVSSIIYTDKVKLEAVDGLNKDQIVEKIQDEVNQSDLTTGEVERIYPAENAKIIGLRRFVTLLQSTFLAGDLNTANDDFILGLVNSDKKELFILLRTRSFVDIFPALKAWENKMFYDLHSLLGIELNSTNGALLTRNFEDGFVENKNARIIYDDSGNIVLMVVFADDRSVIISSSRNAVHEVMLRLASSQIKK